MKIIITTLLLTHFLITVVYAELLANSYLPPPPSSRNGAGYPRGPSSSPSQNFSPQIVAARSLGGQASIAGPSHRAQGASSLQVKSFGRSNHAEPSGYDSNAANYARNALEQFNSEPANYNFGYMVNDYQEGTDFGHHEERQEESAQGEYHVVLPDGRKQTVSYKADERGFKPKISYEESQDLARSGYDNNANNIRNGGNNHFGHGSNGGFGHNGRHDANGY